MDYKPVDIGALTDLSGNRFHDDDGNTYIVSTLIQIAKEQELVPFDLPLQAIDLSVDRFEKGDMTIHQVAKHIVRMNKTDLKYPIILDSSGCIMDGWHRILKALIQGKTTIKAIRFVDDPLPSYTKNEKAE